MEKSTRNYEGVVHNLGIEGIVLEPFFSIASQNAEKAMGFYWLEGTKPETPHILARREFVRALYDLFDLSSNEYLGFYKANPKNRERVRDLKVRIANKANPNMVKNPDWLDPLTWNMEEKFVNLEAYFVLDIARQCVIIQEIKGLPHILKNIPDN